MAYFGGPRLQAVGIATHQESHFFRVQRDFSPLFTGGRKGEEEKEEEDEGSPTALGDHYCFLPEEMQQLEAEAWNQAGFSNLLSQRKNQKIRLKSTSFCSSAAPSATGRPERRNGWCICNPPTGGLPRYKSPLLLCCNSPTSCCSSSCRGRVHVHGAVTP